MTIQTINIDEMINLDEAAAAVETGKIAEYFASLPEAVKRELSIEGLHLHLNEAIVEHLRKAANTPMEDMAPAARREALDQIIGAAKSLRFDPLFVGQDAIPTLMKTPHLPPEASKPNGDEAAVAAILREQYSTLLPLVTEVCNQKRNLWNWDEEEYSFKFNRADAHAFVHGLARALDALDTMSIRENSRVAVPA